MAEYVFGDVQGCYDALQRLLTKLDFNESRDRLWFVGDLVNRGPNSLAVLRFIQQLPITPQITLGNHDLYLLDQMLNPTLKRNADDTLTEILNAPDRDEISAWLRKQPLVVHDAEQGIVMAHAGIPPIWTLTEAMQHAHEVECILSGPECAQYLAHSYGNTPNHWSEQLTGFERFRILCSYFTRMRYCNAAGGLHWDYTGPVDNTPQGVYAWYALPNRQAIQETLLFGHWAALAGKCPLENVYALDTGCVWGGTLTALRLSDKQRFTQSGA